MTDLVTWLRVQLDDDERKARRIQASKYFHGVDSDSEAEVLALADPDRVLAEVDAKRRILDLHQCGGRSTGDGYGPDGFAWCATCGSGEPNEYPASWPCATLLLLTLPYGDRPGFDPQWALAAVA